jgi:hypothetical protein
VPAGEARVVLAEEAVVVAADEHLVARLVYDEHLASTVMLMLIVSCCEFYQRHVERA